MSKVQCKLCKEVVERDDAFRTNLQSFCSRDHYVEYSKRSQNKKNKKTVDPLWETIRQEVILLDGGRCRVCGTRYNLHVHHIVYRSERKDDNVGNLVTLCQAHHDLVHSDKEYYQPECQRLVAMREHGSAFARIKIKEN